MTLNDKKETVNHPRVSIVMLNYNGLKYLKRTIDAVLRLEYPNYEFIVVDNGSTDGSIEFIKKYQNIKLLISPRQREKNYACNYAINKAQGDYILLLDNDALIVNQDLLSDLLARYHDGVGAISMSFYDEGCRYSKSYGSYLGYYFIKENNRIPIEDLKKYDHVEISFPSGFCIFIAKNKWLEVGGYDDHLVFGGDDNDLGIKLWLMGYKNHLYSKDLQVHIGMKERQDNKKYFLKWKEMSYAHVYTVFKNYSTKNLVPALIGVIVYNFLKSVKQSAQRLSIGPMISFFQGLYLFAVNLPVAIQKRRLIQSKRMVKKDIFLRIKPPQDIEV